MITEVKSFKFDEDFAESFIDWSERKNGTNTLDEFFPGFADDGEVTAWERNSSDDIKNFQVKLGAANGGKVSFVIDEEDELLIAYVSADGDKMKKAEFAIEDLDLDANPNSFFGYVFDRLEMSGSGKKYESKTSSKRALKEFYDEESDRYVKKLARECAKYDPENPLEYDDFHGIADEDGILPYDDIECYYDDYLDYFKEYAEKAKKAKERAAKKAAREAAKGSLDESTDYEDRYIRRLARECANYDPENPLEYDDFFAIVDEEGKIDYDEIQYYYDDYVEAFNEFAEKAKKAKERAAKKAARDAAKAQAEK